MTLSQPY
jgi:hypothetical protein